MKRKISVVIFLVFLLSVTVRADKVYEYDLSKSATEKAEDKVSELLDSLPEEIKKELPESGKALNIEEYDFDFFARVAGNALKEAIVPAVGTASVLMGIVIIASAFHIFSKSVGNPSLEGAFSFCASLCSAMAIFGSIRVVFDTVDKLLSSVSNTMLSVMPVMEAVYIASGNLTTAAVSSTGINLMISLTQSLFSRVISPAVYTLFFLCIVSSVTKNKGMEFMVKTLRGLITGAIIAVMTLMTFVLALQTMASAAGDSVTAKTVKFAMGTYIPIVGGSISETFSVISASVSAIKSLCGIAAIAALLIAFLAPFANILLTRIAIGLSGACAEVIGCEREGLLLCECKSICDILIAVSIASCVMFIVALGIFCSVGVG